MPWIFFPLFLSFFRLFSFIALFFIFLSTQLFKPSPLILSNSAESPVRPAETGSLRRCVLGTTAFLTQLTSLPHTAATGLVDLRNARGVDSPCRGFDLRAPQKPAISSTLIPPNHGSFSLFSLYFCFFFPPPFSSIPTKTEKEKAGCPAYSSRQPSMNSLCFFT